MVPHLITHIQHTYMYIQWSLILQHTYNTHTCIYSGPWSYNTHTCFYSGPWSYNTHTCIYSVPWLVHIHFCKYCMMWSKYIPVSTCMWDCFPLFPDDGLRQHPVNSGWCLEASFGHHQIDTMIMVTASNILKPPYGVIFGSKNIFIVPFYTFNDGFDLAIFIFRHLY